MAHCIGAADFRRASRSTQLQHKLGHVPQCCAIIMMLLFQCVLMLDAYALHQI